MSDSNQLISPPLVGQQITDTTSPTSPKERASEEIFDSQDSRDVKGYFASPTDRFQRPRKATRKVTKQDLPSSSSTVDTSAIFSTPRESSSSPRNGSEHEQSPTSQSPALSRNHSKHDGRTSPGNRSSSPDGGKNDGDLTIRKARPRSDFIELPMIKSPTDPTEQRDKEIAMALADIKRLQTRISDLEEGSDRDKAESCADMERLNDKLTSISVAKTAIARQFTKAQKVQEDVEEHAAEVMKENAKLDQLNQDLRRETLQARSIERDCKILDASQVSQIAELREQLARKTKLAEQLEDQFVMFSNGRAAEAAQGLTNSAAIEEIQRNNLALGTDLQAAKTLIQEQQAELEATRLQIMQFEQQIVFPAEEFLQNGDGDASPSYGSPTHSPRRSDTLIRDPIRRDALIPTLEERRLSDMPALTDGASTCSTTSLASPPPIASPVPVESTGPYDPTKSLPIHSNGLKENTDPLPTYSGSPSENTDPVPIASIGSSDLPKTQHQTTSSTDPPKSRDRQHKSVFDWWPSITKEDPYRIVGPRPKNLADVDDQVEAPASTCETTEVRTVISRKQTRNAGIQIDCPSLIPPTTTSNAGTQTDLPRPPAAALPPRSPVAAREGRPMWHHIALGTTLLLFLVGHAVFVERRIWGGANELSRRAVVSMRDEWWGSPWIERMGYTLDQTLLVDRTGFC